MARIRTIKPEFWSDGAIIECSTNARLLFVGTWTFSDDAGNLDRSAKQLKAQVFPADNFDCEPLIQELIAHGLLVEYSSNEKKYLHIQSFTKHQRVDRPGPARCPIFDESTIIPRTVVEPSSSLPPRKGREGKGEVKGKGKTKPPSDWKPSERTANLVTAQYSLPPDGVERYTEAFLDACAAKGYEYEDFDAAFRNCVRQDWPKLRMNGTLAPRKKTAAELLDESEAARH